MTFNDLQLVLPIQKALQNKGYIQPTPIQQQAIPYLLQHKDLLGSAQTGTGKTAAFAIPIIQHIYQNKQNQQGKRKIQALIVTPTRELAIQIAENFTAYAKHTGLRNAVIFGGVKQTSQVSLLKQGVDILVATPGRLLDLMGQGFISLKDIRYFVLDEADHMLDMGFIHDIKKLLDALPENRQSLFFSATMPKQIEALSKQILKKDYVRVTIKPQQATAELVDQEVYFVTKNDKIKLLSDLILKKNPASVLVFSRTKHGANKIVKLLARKNIKAEAIHGNKSQAARQKTLKAFKTGRLQVLVATDIAARGIDVSKLELVVNYDLPNISETYIHRIGRTGRAKESGVAISFCAADERSFLRDIEKLIKQKIPQMLNHAYHDDSKELPPLKPGGGRRNPKPKSASNRSHTSRNRKRH